MASSYLTGICATTAVGTSNYPTDATLATEVRDGRSDATLGANHRVTDDPILSDKTESNPPHLVIHLTTE